MSDEIRHAIDRFPEQEETIRTLYETNTSFEALAREHCAVSEQLGRHEAGGAEEERDFETLRRRRAALEEEMLIIMDQSSRV